MATAKVLTCVNCGAPVPTGFEATDDAEFQLTGCVECPNCGQSNDLARVQMAPLRYAELVQWLSTHPLSEGNCQHSGIRGPAQAFAANVSGVALLAILPAVSTHFEKLNQFLLDIVTFRKTGQLGGKVETGPISAPEMKAVFDELQAGGALMGITNIADAASAFEYQTVAEIKIRAGLRSLLSSTLVASWTSFETLAGDLWEAVVNARPSLATKLGKPIKPNILQKYDYNVAKSMGAIMTEIDAVSFTRLENIRAAYKYVFADNYGDSIMAAIEDKSLDALSQARNLVVHKAGRCDAEYQRRAAGLPQLPQLKIGEPLPLDGVLVQRLIEPAFANCHLLIKSVGNWLTSHPD
jgi:hypothetical protein